MSDDRLLDAVRSIVYSLLPNFKYLGFHRYVVHSWNDAAQEGDLQPADSSKGLPNVTKIYARSPGIAQKLEKGDEVLLGFEDSDPTKPFVACFPRPDGPSLPIARQGDLTATSMVLVPELTPAGQPIPNVYNISLTTLPPPPFTPLGGPITFYGVISSGSLRNKSK